MSFYIMDCTLRDGGNQNDWQFTSEDICTIVENLDKSGINYIEIGYRGGSGSKKSSNVGVTGQCPLEFLNSLPKLTNAAYAVMVVPSVCKLDNLDDLTQSPISLVRVAAYPHNVQNAFPFISRLKELGFLVSMNLMSVSYASLEEIITIARQAESLGANLFYIADSFGTLRPDGVSKIVSRLKLEIGCAIGFHGHNNLGLAFSNVLSALDAGATYIDTSLCGMARGAGNLPTEQLLAAMTNWQSYQMNFHMRPVLVASEYVLNNLLKEPMRISTPEILCGIHNLHYYFYDIIVQKCRESNLDIEQICGVLSEIRPVKVDTKYVDEACKIVLQNQRS